MSQAHCSQQQAGAVFWGDMEGSWRQEEQESAWCTSVCLDAGWERQGRACSTVAAWWACYLLVLYKELAAGAGCAQGWGAPQWIYSAVALRKAGLQLMAAGNSGSIWSNCWSSRDIKGSAQLWQAPCHHSWPLHFKVEWISLSLGAVTCRDIVLSGPLIMNAGRLKSVQPNNCFLILLWNRLEDSSCMRTGRSSSLLTGHLPWHGNEHCATSDLELQHPHLEQWQWQSKAGQTKRSRDQLQGDAARQHDSSPTFRWEGKLVVGRAQEEQWHNWDGYSC